MKIVLTFPMMALKDILYKCSAFFPWLKTLEARYTDQGLQEEGSLDR